MNNNYTLSKICKIKYVEKDDDFVGLKILNGELNLNLPLGFRIVKDDEINRKVVYNLFKAISAFTVNDKNANDVFDTFSGKGGFSFQCYNWIIKNFVENDYYRLTEEQYNRSGSGKINWKKTITQVNPNICNGEIVYFDLVRKVFKQNNDHILTHIHKYCVYEANKKIGWLYGDLSIEKPMLKFNRTLFIDSLKKELNQTFDDNKKLLIKNMIDMITGLDSSKTNQKYFEYGTKQFGNVWGKMLDNMFGNLNVKDFYPRTYWNLTSGTILESFTSEQDTVMKQNDSIYIIDSKYYKYGLSGNVNHLPSTASIHKQIIYGDYIYSNKDVIKTNFENVLNVAVLPYNKDKNKLGLEKELVYVGFANSNWNNENVSKSHSRVHAFLIDVNFLINNFNLKKYRKFIVSEIQNEIN